MQKIHHRCRTHHNTGKKPGMEIQHINAQKQTVRHNGKRNTFPLVRVLHIQQIQKNTETLFP